MNKRPVFFFIILSVFLFPLNQKLRAQLPDSMVNFSYADSASYADYMAGNWDKVINTCNLAFGKGYNSYYMQARMGIAYFNQKQYRLAIEHFENARNMDKSDIYLSEYLYYSYLYSGYTLYAEKFRNKWPAHVREKLKMESDNRLKLFAARAGYNFTQNTNTLTISDLNGDYNIKGQQSIRNSYYFAGLESNWISEGGGGSNLSYDFSQVYKTERIQFNTPTVLSFDGSTIQHMLHYTYDFSPSPQHYFMFGALLASGSTSILNTDSAFQNMAWSNYAELLSLSYSDYALHIAYSFSMPLYSIFTEAALGNIGNNSLIQGSLLANWYPFANLNTTLSAGLSFYKNDNQGIAYKGILSQKLYKKWYLSALAEYGDHANMLAMGGAYVYNNPDEMLWQTGAYLTYYGKQFRVSLGGLQAYSTHFYEMNTSRDNTTTKSVKYWNTIINTSISWNF